MPRYTHEFAQFPNKLLTPHNYKDVTDEIVADIIKIKNYISSGDYASALNYLNEDPSLRQYLMTAEDMNFIDEETRNVEIYAKNVQQQIFYNDPEDDVLTVCSEGDIWIS